MAKINDSHAKLLERAQARAGRIGANWARDLFSMPGTSGLQIALPRVNNIADQDLKDHALQATIIWNGREDQMQRAIDMIKGYFTLKATLTIGDQYFRAFRTRMAWSKCQPQLEESLKISQQEDSEEAQNESHPTASENYQDKPHRALDLLLHRITPANAPSAHSEFRCAVRAF